MPNIRFDHPDGRTLYVKPARLGRIRLLEQNGFVRVEEVAEARPVATLTALPVRVVTALQQADLRTDADVRGVPDEFLLSIPGIGPARLAQIREATDVG